MRPRLTPDRLGRPRIRTPGPLAYLAALALLVLGACGPEGTLGDGGSSPEPEPALEVTAEPGYLDLRDASEATVSVQADGAWTAETDQAWLSIEPARGEGDATVQVRVRRDGLVADTYAGSVLFRGARPEATVEVLLGFPALRGQLANADGTVRAGSSLRMHNGDAPGDAPFAGPPEPRRAEDQLIVAMNRPMVAWLSQRSTEGLAERARSLDFTTLRSAASQLTAEYGLPAPRPVALQSDLFVVTARDLPATRAALEADGRVAFTAPNYLYEPLAAPDDPLYAEQWHYAAIGLDASRDLTLGAERVVVAVIDSAIDTAHADLAAKIVPGFDFASNTSEIQTPPDPHGTHVAGTAAATTDNGVGVAGVAANARLMPLNVFPEGSGASSVDVARALYFAAGACPYLRDGSFVCGEAPVDVVNLSLGSINPSCEATSYDATMEDGLAYALGRGVALVAAAGNDACDRLGWPAESPTTIAVSAVGPSLTLTPYSNYGPDVFLAAPGGDQSGGSADGVLSTLPGDGYGFFQGTSMASPHVAGVAALVRSVNPGLSPSAIYDLLARTATDLGASGPDTSYGYGLVNAEAAVAEARSLLEASTLAFVARVSGPISRVVAVAADGSFVFPDLPEGAYLLEVGTDVDENGVLAEPGEFYASRVVTIDHDGGDVRVEVRATAR